jgi:hypothetical protein
VVDERGWLPRERRELALMLFSADRCTEVRELRERVREQQAKLKATKGRAWALPGRRRWPRLSCGVGLGQAARAGVGCGLGSGSGVGRTAVGAPGRLTDGWVWWPGWLVRPLSQ